MKTLSRFVLMRGKKCFIGLRAILAIFTVTLLVTSTRAAAQEEVLYSFHYDNGTDGYAPSAGLIFDTAGNLYGTTYWGGTYSCPGSHGCGTVFELTPIAGGGWTEQVLHSFGSGTDGIWPSAGLTFDAAGSLYGTTSWGGTYGYGTVFELTPAPGGGWTEKVLHNFNGTDGAAPYAGLIFDAAGHLYGTTKEGGAYGYGAIFELARSVSAVGGGWTEKVLHSFNSTDGAGPVAGLIFDAGGKLYGTTIQGGTYNDGAVFELARSVSAVGGSWTEKVLHSFNSTDGAGPVAGLIFDAVGNLYGTTLYDGTYENCDYGAGCGTVFELTSIVGGGWTEQVLHSFGGGADGQNPQAGMIFDAAGNLYGTTNVGGDEGGGTVFEIRP
jgi:uncharacterized repeat protein (TIGR03803 family)